MIGLGEVFIQVANCQLDNPATVCSTLIGRVSYRKGGGGISIPKHELSLPPQKLLTSSYTSQSGVNLGQSGVKQHHFPSPHLTGEKNNLRLVWWHICISLTSYLLGLHYLNEEVTSQHLHENKYFILKF